MDQSRKRAREGEGDADAALRQRQQHADALADGRCAVGEDEPWQRSLGVFELPWLKCRSGLGVATGGWELRDVFFRSLVDGRAAAIGIPDDRLSPPPSKQTLFDDVEAWLAAAGDGEVDPFWRSVLEGAQARRVTPKREPGGQQVPRGTPPRADVASYTQD
jgi:hypothetical protein